MTGAGAGAAAGRGRGGAAAVLAAVLVLAACGNREANRIADTTGFRADLAAPRDDRRAFTVTVRAAGTDPAAAQQAGRYAATVHCLEEFGGSRIAWDAASAAAPETLALTDEGALVLQGRCAAR
jgi:hypothetical protein